MYNEEVKELRGIGKYQLSYEEKHQTLNAICEEYDISKSYPCYILKENVPARAKYALTGTRKNFTQIVLPYHT